MGRHSRTTFRRLSCSALRLFAVLVVVLVVGGVFLFAGPGDRAPDAAEVSKSHTSSHVERPLRLSFIGDIMAHDVNYRMDDFSRIYTEVAPHFADSDHVFGQLEFVVDPDRPYATYPRFNVHPAYVEAAIDAGVDIFSIANNHTTDYKADGVLATLASMAELTERHDIHYSGARAEPDQSLDIVELEWRGRSIGFLAITRILNDWDGWELTYVIDWSRRSTERFLDRLEEATDDYDLFVLSVHDGTEYQPYPDARSIAFFREAVGAGVDILWGHHPHVLQPWEVVERDDGRRAVIMPSMGNFVSGQTWGIGPDDTDHWRANTGDSAIFRTTVDFDERGASIIDIDPLLITHYHHPAGGVSVEILMPMADRDDVGDGRRGFYEDRRRRSGRFARRETYENLEYNLPEYNPGENQGGR